MQDDELEGTIIERVARTWFCTGACDQRWIDRVKWRERLRDLIEQVFQAALNREAGPRIRDDYLPLTLRLKNIVYVQVY